MITLNCFLLIQTLQHSLDKFKRVLPTEKYNDLVSLVRQLQEKMITREKFDLHYFEIMLPYVTPQVLPAHFKDTSEIHVPPYKLTLEAQNRFLQFFQISRHQKHELLKNHPELIPVLRQFVILQRQNHVSVTLGDTVLMMEGEISISTDDGNRESEEEQPPIKKRRLSKDESSSTHDNNVTEIANLQTLVQKLQADVERLQSLYVEPCTETLEKLGYEELSGMHDQLLSTLRVVSKVMKTKYMSEQNEKYGLSCILCYDNRRNVIFRPCSHVLQCEKCPVPKECPMCRKKVEIANKIFI